jgi:hypothetical protein
MVEYLYAFGFEASIRNPDLNPIFSKPSILPQSLFLINHFRLRMPSCKPFRISPEAVAIVD